MPRTERRRRRRAMVPRWFYAFVPNRLAGGLTGTLMPLFIVQVLSGNMASVGWLSSVTSLASVPANVIWGNLSDRSNRRLPFILVGLIAFAVTTILIGLGETVVAIAILSSIGGLLGTATGPASSALTIESVPEKDLPVAYGWFNQIGGLAYVAGMLVGMAWLDYLPEIFGEETVMRGLFVLAGGMALLSPLMAAMWIHEPRRRLVDRRFIPALIGRFNAGTIERVVFHIPRAIFFIPRLAWLRDVRQQLSSDLGKYFIYSLLMFLGVNLVFMPLPVYLTDVIGATNGQVFLISLVKSIVDTFFFVPMGRLLSRRRGIGLQAQAAFLRMFLFAILAALAVFRMPLLAALGIIVVVQIFNGITWAAISVSGPTAVAVLAPKGGEARSMGAYTAVTSVAGIIGGPMTGYLVDSFGYVFAYGLASIVMLLTAVLMWRLKSDALEGAPQVPTRELIAGKPRGAEKPAD
ncbi:MAG TPA: MFS transporter [Anaerolineaceae bacterium]|nr:MFS transporter [Anaerolineaceae bacterium]